eukprot:201684_1
MTSQIGLQNQGATCYLNSLIQQSRFIPELKKELFSLTKEDIYDDKGEIKPSKHIVWEITKLIAKMELNQENNALSTKPLTNAFGWNGAQVIQQHDINDVYNILLDGINTAMPQNKKFYDKYFTGKVVNVSNCVDCESLSKNKENFTQINVPIIKAIKHGFPIKFEHLYNSLIKLFLDTEKLQGKNKYFCIECDTKVIANKISRITHLPIILILNLSQYMMLDGQQIKLNETLRCPLDLDLSMFINEQYSEMDSNIIKQYDLNGIILHSGGTGSGHYISIVRSLKSSDDEKEKDVTQWFRFDDNNDVTIHNDKEIEGLFIGNNKFTPYMVIYRRKYMNNMSSEIPKFIQNAIDGK